MDFIVDGLANGRMVRILSVVDAFTRECLALEADTSLGSGRVTRVLDRLIEERGRPENVRSDNGPEFTSRRMLGWAEDAKDQTGAYPTGPAHAERPRRELPRPAARRMPQRELVPHPQRCAHDRWIAGARSITGNGPHSSLAYRTPREFARIAGLWKCGKQRTLPTFPQQKQRLRVNFKAKT